MASFAAAMRHFLAFFLLITCSAAAAEKPNIIFILADDLGWGDLGCYGNKIIRTPNLDAMAKQGTLFTQFYVNASVCSPSRCAFFTGQYPARHRIHGHYAAKEQNDARGMSNWLEPQVPNAARLMKSAGYTTAHIGKWHLGNNSGGPPTAETALTLSAPGKKTERTDRVRILTSGRNPRLCSSMNRSSSSSRRGTCRFISSFGRWCRMPR